MNDDEIEEAAWRAYLTAEGDGSTVEGVVAAWRAGYEQGANDARLSAAKHWVECCRGGADHYGQGRADALADRELVQDAYYEHMRALVDGEGRYA